MVTEFRVDVPVKRADAYLSEKLGISRNQVQRLIEQHHIAVNGRLFKASAPLRSGDTITATIPEPEASGILVPQPIALDILYEDSSIIVIDKNKGIVVHPAHGHRDDTLVNALLYHCSDLRGIGGTIRPGVVHRLDKDTAGVMVFAKDEDSYRELQRQFKEREVSKIYRALVLGRPPKQEDTLITGIGRSRKDRKKFAVTGEGREAVTSYRLLKSSGGVSLVELNIRTGRTHQIRVHMEHLGCPVAGDPCYNKKNYRNSIKSDELLEKILAINGQALCACSLGFIHPATGRKMEFSGKIPADMQEVIDWMENHGTD